MRLSLGCVLLLTFAISVSATPFSDLYFFGDSLSDSGNVSALTAGLYPSAPYYDGRFSNGPVWAEIFSNLQGHPTAGSYAGMTLGANYLNLSIDGPGNNYAIAGARTDTTGTLDEVNIPSGVLVQVYYYLSQKNRVSDPNALYVLFAGANDIRDAAQLAPAERDQMANAAAYNMTLAAYLLGQSGARNFLILNEPDIGLTPEAQLERNDAASATAASRQYNLALNYFMSSLSFPGEQLYQFDTFDLFDLLYNDALSGGTLTGITNATTPCFAGFAGSTGTNCADSIFSDDLHPTAKVHALLGYAVNNMLSTGSSFGSPPQLLATSFLSAQVVPEPATFVQMGIGLGLLAWRRRRTRRGR